MFVLKDDMMCPVLWLSVPVMALSAVGPRRDFEDFAVAF